MNTSLIANSDKIKYAHLFEIELAILTVMSDVSNTNVIIVDDIDKCFIGMSLAYKYISSNITYIDIVNVTDINRYGSYIIVDKTITITKNNKICETLHTTSPYPYYDGSKEYLEFMHSSFGTLTGKLLFTDYDIPIVSDYVKRDVYGDEGYVMYMPYSIQYKEVSVDKSGKITTGEITLANENQIASQIVLTHSALRNREIIIKKVYFEESLWTDEQNKLYNLYQICIPLKGNTYVGATDNSRIPSTELNDFYEYRYLPAENIKTEFKGKIDNIGLTSEVATITALLNLDTEQGVIIPKRKYNRIKCDFNYKGDDCRFKSSIKLTSSILNNDTSISISSTVGTPFFSNVEPNEEFIIKIDNELLLVNAVNITTKINLYNFIAGRNFGGMNLYTATLTIKTRGYGGTTAESHSANTIVDLPFCGKTEHDCIMRGHIPAFGGFPAIPKNKSYGTGSNS